MNDFVIEDFQRQIDELQARIDKLDTLETGTISRLNVGAMSTLTIDTGAVTMTKSYHEIAAEGGGADNLDTISGGTDGDILIIQSASGDTITVKDAIDNLMLTGDLTLDDPKDKAILFSDGTNWHEISSTNNA